MLADPAGPDDLFTGRALTGEAGQRLQAFLAAAGLTSRYLILRTLPVDTSDLTAARRDALVDRAEVRAIHAEILRRVVIDVGQLRSGRRRGRGPRGAAAARRTSSRRV